MVKGLLSYEMFCGVTKLSEGFIMDASGSRYHIKKGREGPLSHIAVLLLGIFMGKNGSQNHLQAVFNTNASNIKVMWWLVSFNNELVRKGHENGPECCDEEE